MKKNNKYEINQVLRVVEIETDEGTQYASEIETESPMPPIYLHPTPVTAEDRTNNMWVAEAVIEEGKSRSAAANRLWRPIEQDIETHISDPLADVLDEFQEILDVDDDTAKIMKNTICWDYADSVLRDNWPVEDTVWRHFHDTVSEEIARRAVGEHGEITPIASRYTQEEFGQLIGDAPDEVIYNALRSGVEEVFSIAHAQVVSEEIEMEVNGVIVETQEFFDKRASTQEVIEDGEFNNWIQRWVDANPEDVDWIVQAVTDRARIDICLECAIERTLNSMIVEGDIEMISDHLVPAIQKKIIDSAKGKYCGEHSALQSFDNDTAWQFLNFSTNFGWDGADNAFDRDFFSQMVTEMELADFDECFAKSLRGVIYWAEYLVYKDVLTSARERGAL